MVVTLTPAEFRFATRAGFERQVENLIARRVDGNDFRGDGWQVAAMGAVGEFVAAVALGLPWRGPGTLRGPDVGPLQVKWTGYEKGKLIVKETDDAGPRYLLVTGVYPRFTLRGWLPGRAAKLPGYKKELQPGRPAYCVDQWRLCPVETVLSAEADHVGA